MKKIIFNNLLKEIVFFFLISSFALTLIIWVIQAVNYLDIVTEDGHSFKVYFFFTLLSLPKIFSQSLPFVFFLSVFYIISDFEDKNQLLIYWSHGIGKLQVVNKIIQLSIIFALVQIFFSTIIVPFTQDKSRSFIRNSNLDFFPNLIKPKKFIDTVKGLTIFIEKKNDSSSYDNILLKDELNKNNTQIIIAKKGKILLRDNKKILILDNGEIIRITNNKKTTSFNFKTTQFDLEKYSSKTTKTPKIQEIATINLLKCFNFLINTNNSNTIIKNLKCNSGFLKNIYQELYKRIYLPIYIVLLSLISSLVLLKSKNTQGYFLFKIKIFLTGVFFIIISDILLNFTGRKITTDLIYIMIPILSFFLIYQILIFKLRIKQ
ncbi:LptF/LptG family permease [Candidatus Pelagibacter sp. Uisw_116]|uniref:LptF/LptG family permease n=1 Tax=Candidatus Pelagibacter sp. Uisw_116 TaxID=3230986 RepID=UPI0039E9AD4A